MIRLIAGKSIKERKKTFMKIEKYHFFHNTSKGQILLSIIYIVLGFVLLIYPQATASFLCYGIGICCLIFGIIRFFSYFQGKKQGNTFFLDPFLGIVFLIIAIFTLFFQPLVISILPIILGIIVLMDSFLLFQRSTLLKTSGIPQWKFSLILSILILILGITLIINPFSSAMFMIQFLGITIILDGITIILNAFYFSKDH